jgi:leucyl/phenylalanyl-tRNA--protein transferase
MRHPPQPIAWLVDGQAFPPVDQAWGPQAPAPGLLAAGGSLNVTTLLQAYERGIFPWFSAGQPVLWWSPDPRMVLQVAHFRLHRSLKKAIQRFRQTPGCALTMNQAFGEVIRQCANKPRAGQSGTWIVPEMVAAYEALHRAGHAHSVETWIDGQLAGGLYCVNLGGMVFGESMFAHRTDASKLAISALVGFCRAHGMDLIDCQQNTAHLASLGAAEVPRPDFIAAVAERVTRPSAAWNFSPLYWDLIC